MLKFWIELFFFIRVFRSNFELLIRKLVLAGAIDLDFELIGVFSAQESQLFNCAKIDNHLEGAIAGAIAGTGGDWLFD